LAEKAKESRSSSRNINDKEMTTTDHGDNCATRRQLLITRKRNNACYNKGTDDTKTNSYIL